MNPDDMKEEQLTQGQPVDIVSRTVRLEAAEVLRGSAGVSAS
jgi:hypothetical protein